MTREEAINAITQFIENYACGSDLDGLREAIESLKNRPHEKWEECNNCPKRNNKLACLLNECKIREQKYKETVRKWHKEWAAEKLCFACEHCKHREAWEHSCRTTEAYCELTDKVILGPDTCGKWVEGEVKWNE